MSADSNTPTEHDIKHAMSTLTDEERAAMEDELSEDEKAALAAVAAAAKDDDDDGDDEPADPPAAAPAPAAAAPAAAPAEAPAPAAAPAPAPADAVAAAPAPAVAAEAAPAPRPRAETVYHAELPADYDDRVKKLAEDRKDLSAKFEAGEITVQEYTAKSEELAEQRDELNALRVKADISRESRAQSQRQQWLNAVESFVEEVRAAGGVDYSTDKARNHDLDGFVRALAQNPANEDKEMGWFLREAHKRVLALHGEAAAPAPSPASAPAPAAPAASKPAARTPPVAAAPATLAHVPGGDAPSDTGDEFADLDSLDGDKLEAALSRMSADKRARYLAGA